MDDRQYIPKFPHAILYRLGFFLFLGILLCFSCNQDAIFFSIEYETQLKDPLIPGGPSRIVEFNNDLYVGGGNGIYRYAIVDGAAQWKLMSAQPGGRIIDLAATNTHLYALSFTGSSVDSARLSRLKDDGSDWDEIENETGYNRMSTIHSAEDTIFIGAYQGSSGASMRVLYIKGAATALTSGWTFDSYGLLNGAAKLGSNYYIAVESSGIIKIAEADLDIWAAGTGINPIPDSESHNFTGLIVNNNILIAVGSDGMVWTIDNNGDKKTDKPYNFDFSGAIALWKKDKDDPSPCLLLLGRTVSGGNISTYYTYGYYEIFIGDNELGTRYSPGDDTPTTVNINAKYEASIGTRVVNSLYQAPKDLDDSMPVFASTQRDGLWVCRDNEWNVQN